MKRNYNWHCLKSWFGFLILEFCLAQKTWDVVVPDSGSLGIELSSALSVVRLTKDSTLENQEDIRKGDLLVAVNGKVNKFVPAFK